jgi:DNA polymerase elongation subunit (family B)
MEVRIFDFQTVCRRNEEVDIHLDANLFIIQMFGINEKGETFSIEVHDFKPYFYCLVPSHYTILDKNRFVEHVKQRVGTYYADSIVDAALVKRKKIDGFDGQLEHKFICFKFRGMSSFYKARNLWYNEIKKNDEIKQVLKPHGLSFMGDNIKLYEANIPPLLRFFHIKEISPSGWIKLPKTMPGNNTTTCTHDFIVSAKEIIALPNKETVVPYKICSFDIEASSSHGDFPLPTKDYKKLAENIIDEFQHVTTDHEEILANCVYAAFGYYELHSIDIVYPKSPITEDEIALILDDWMNAPIRGDAVEDEVNSSDSETETDPVEIKEMTVIELLKSNHPLKVLELRKALNSAFPPIEGDKVTFIGSTFINYGNARPYLNHCIVLGGCTPIDNIEIQCCKTERDVLLAWTDVIQRENPDILIGYNIFGFDEQFMFKRSVETNCAYEFLALTRNKNVLSGKQEQGVLNIETKSVFLASGEYNLNYFKMDGRIHLDLYTVFRRDYNFDSYKLDSVSAYFIGDKVTKLQHIENTTLVYSKNLQGLEKTNYVVFEEISHSSDFYRNGKKFKVMEVFADHFILHSIVHPDMKKQVKWCLAKDDVDHHDIFRLANGSDDDRAIIATYCVQDCNLVQHLLQKTDMITGFIEMSTICSVPIDFLIMRGQGIKLTSYISKQCRKRNTLMPVLQTKEYDDGYEGAIVLDPKCNIYTEDPVAVLDYKSLYPSAMISENICSSSKVWTKEYDLTGSLLIETGVKHGNVFIYDNLEAYTYVNITYDTYKYIRKTPKSKAVKTKSGYKVCRFAQFQEKAIMPSVLEELLQARSATRKLIQKETNEFMKNILDKRQNAYKVTANSLYGQCGARTSTFYDKDVAASCTSTGRTLLIYAKTMIEEVYDHLDCETSEGMINATAEYIYGDTDSVFFKFTLLKDGVKLIGKDALGLTIELAKEAGQLATKFLKQPHELEYEKTFFPFILLSKKRYVGMLYENDTVHCSRKSMGIVLKRRDNAPIVKDVYGGLIDLLMKDGNVENAITFVREKVSELKSGQIALDKLIITKSLRSGYKKPLQMAHKVLADRIGKRDPGNKPKPGDRIRFVFVKTQSKKKQLQGEKIETPEYIKEKSLEPDYEHYITNQLMKPIQQVMELVLDNIPEFQDHRERMNVELAKLKIALPEEKFLKKQETIRYKEVNRILFE